MIRVRSEEKNRSSRAIASRRGFQEGDTARRRPSVGKGVACVQKWTSDSVAAGQNIDLYHVCAILTIISHSAGSGDKGRRGPRRFTGLRMPPQEEWSCLQRQELSSRYEAVFLEVSSKEQGKPTG